MNQAHLHLLVNHLPVFAVTFGLLALVWTIARRSGEMRWASIGLFLLAGVSAWVAAETGEGAEEIVERIPGVTKALIHNHEEAAEIANVFVWILAASAAGLAGIVRIRPQLLKAYQIGVLILALISSGLLARTAFLGGEIRHDEIHDETP